MTNPTPPRNVFILNPSILGAFDIRWDMPSVLAENSSFTILGVDVYRSFDSPDGPYQKLNSVPVVVPYYADDTTLIVESDNVSSSFFSKGNDSLQSWGFTTSKPIMEYNLFGPKDSSDPRSVDVLVDGEPAMVASVDGGQKKVWLVSLPYIDPITQKRKTPKLPGVGDVVTAQYKTLGNDSRAILSRRTYYKLVTVAVEGTTALVDATAVTSQQTDGMDYIWSEAIHRNKWILKQGGEPVKLFIRKWAGERCPCYSNTHKQSTKICTTCYGAGFVGGYEGPFDILVAPENANWSMRHTPAGVTNSKQNSTWTIGGPLLSPRDFYVNLSGERFLIGPINNVKHRGVPLQQFFDISLVDHNDIIYQVQITPRPLALITDHPLIPDNREVRGTTSTFEEIEY